MPAFTAIYDEHFGFVWAVLRRLGVGDADIEDVVQEVFIVVHRRMHAYEARASLRTWLYAIAVRVFWNHARRRRNQPVLAETSSSTLPALDGDPERFTQRREADDLLRDLLGKLDPAKRTVFVLAELEGLTAPEIAKITGANERTVYSRLRVARSSFEAGLARARARERNDLSVGQLARRGDDRPPAGAQQRTWAALMLQLAADPVVPLGTIGVAATVKAAMISLGLGVGALGLVYAVTIPVRAREPAPPRIATVGTVASDGSLPEPPITAAEIVPPPAPERSQPATERVEPSRTRERSRPAVAPPSSDAVMQELALMQRARTALRSGDAQQALAALDEHARRFPNGELAPERDRSRITALCRLDRSADADALAHRLELPTPACATAAKR